MYGIFLLSLLLLLLIFFLLPIFILIFLSITHHSKMDESLVGAALAGLACPRSVALAAQE